MRVDIWSDLVCPWCYIGKRRFERALASFEHRDQVHVVHRSFQLDPSAPAGQTFDRRAMLMRKYGWSEARAEQMDEQLVQTAVAEGLEYHLGGGVTGNTLDAHRVVHLAADRGVPDAAIERLYRAHFSERRSLFEHESLAALAGDAGLLEDDVRRMLSGHEYEDAVRRDGEHARAIGVSGVPFFVFDERLGVSGARSAEVLSGALTSAWAASSTAAPVPEGG